MRTIHISEIREGDKILIDFKPILVLTVSEVVLAENCVRCNDNPMEFYPDHNGMFISPIHPEGISNKVNSKPANCAISNANCSLLPVPLDVIEDLKSMSNNYQLISECYVIPKSVIDVFIEYLESQRQ